MVRKLKQFSALGLQHKQVFIKAWFVLAWMRAAILIVSFKYLAESLPGSGVGGTAAAERPSRFVKIDLSAKNYYRYLLYTVTTHKMAGQGVQPAGNLMKNTFLRIIMLGLLVVLPTGASAVMDETAAYSTVQSMMSSGSSAAEIIAALTDDGRTLAESTVFAMVSGGEDMRVAFATAGVKSATSLVEAQSVVDAVLATAGNTGPVAEAVHGAMHTYTKYMHQPSTYTGGNIATGGGAVSPST